MIATSTTWRLYILLVGERSRLQRILLRALRVFTTGYHHESRNRRLIL
jgi:hypothetical protein